MAADARTERIEADKKTAVVARRQLQAARFSRQEKLYREIREREETIRDKERRVYDLKKKNQELEKFKFVLEYLSLIHISEPTRPY